MKELGDKFFNAIATIRTPLTLAGASVMAMYLTYRQILTLNIFSNIGSANTYSLLALILHLCFWLAILATILGVGSFALPILLNYLDTRRNSRVKLIDAQFDPTQSDYEKVHQDGAELIKPKPTEDFES
jgi:hypothetical protein